MTDSLRFAFGLHLHQPVGNFGAVFEQHLTEVYAPLIESFEREDLFPATFHLSGPLLAWLERHGSGFLDRVGTHVAEGRIELLLSGYDEPILAMLPPADRAEQIARMHETLRARFGIDAKGLWLTERVWEPDLTADLADAGVQYALVDDRHFLVAGHRREELHQHWRTEAAGKTIALFPIDEQLRYLVPFRPPEELAVYFRALRAAGHRLAVLADDGEKFGGWPGTHKWVYDEGWMGRFGETIRGMRDAGEITLCTFSQALDALPPGGLTYLPSASYREMEGWALPVAAQRRLRAVETTLGPKRVEGEDGAIVRGTHWKSFLVKYSEANRMHKKMLALSTLCRRRGEPREVRAAVGRAQCNDAYWHGVFGGLYLPHLREAIWRNLAEAERLLRSGEPLAVEQCDIDGDGKKEIWIHSAAFSAIVAPHRGGAVEEFTRFDTGYNYADVLTRRFEFYHDPESRRPIMQGEDGEATGAPSIHDIEAALVLDELPPFDPEPRAILVERFVRDEVTVQTMASGAWAPIRSWASATGPTDITCDGGHAVITIHLPGLEKRLRFGRDGALQVSYRWDPPTASEALWFLVENSLSRPMEIVAPGAERWSYPVETVAKSERGFDRTVQGEAVVCRWPADRGTAELMLGFGS